MADRPAPPANPSKAVSTLEIAAKAIRVNGLGEPPGDVDLAGRIEHVINSLASWLRAYYSEINPKNLPPAGEHYQWATTGGGYDRQYNTPAILHDAATALGMEISDVHAAMVDAGVIRQTESIQWTALRQFFNRHDIELRVTSSEVDPKAGDLSAAHVSEQPKDKRVKPTGIPGS